MRFSCKWIPYAKGTLLESARLNRDFRLGHFLADNLVASRSDGILSGLRVRVCGGALYLEPGLFRLGSLAWLDTQMPIELPPVNEWRRLWLYPTDDAGGFELDWLPDVEIARDGLCLCRLHCTSASILVDSWAVSGKEQDDPAHWLRSLTGAGTPQLEFAMGSSRGSRPTLLPCVQRGLAPSEPITLKLCLLNGLFPLMDYFPDANSWQHALEKLAKLLAPEKKDDTQRDDPRKVRTFY